MGGKRVRVCLGRHALQARAITRVAHGFAFGGRRRELQSIRCHGDHRIAAAVGLELIAFAGMIGAHEQQVQMLVTGRANLPLELHGLAARPAAGPGEACAYRWQAAETRFGRGIGRHLPVDDQQRYGVRRAFGRRAGRCFLEGAEDLLEEIHAYSSAAQAPIFPSTTGSPPSPGSR